MNTPPTPNTAGAPAAESQEQAGTFRMENLVSGGIDDLSAGPPRRAPAQLLLLVGLLVAAGAALLVMRTLGMGPLAATGEVKIDYDYDKQPAGKDHTRVLEDLTASHVAAQVPREQVQKNPFEMGELSGVTAEGTDAADALRLRLEEQESKRRQQEAQARQAAIDTAFASFRLHGILGGAEPIARINGRTVRVGDALGEHFTVTAIEGRVVHLEADEKEWVLSLDDARAPRSQPRPAAPAKPRNH